MARSFVAALSCALVLTSLACDNESPSGPTETAGGLATSAGSGARAGTSGSAGSPAAGRGNAGAAPGGAGTGAGISGGSAGTGAAGSGGSQAGSAGTASSAGTGGTSGTGGGPAAPGGPRTAAGFASLAPPMGEPLDGKGKELTPPPPAGWVWYEIEGAVCRDGSPTGFYVHTGSANKLLVFLEGGGACSNTGFCNFNPANVNLVLAGDGQTVLNTALGAIAGRQQPGVYTQADHAGAPAGVFDFANAQNPFKDWNQVYVPYCTGDVHFGTKKNASVPGLTNQQFVGYLNMKLFISRLVPTFKDKVDHVILTGSSAGGFGAALNYSMVQDSFGEVAVDAISDSGPPFDDKYMPICMQKRWRDSWGFEDSLPKDCTDCRQADGGGLLKMADYLLKKHPYARIGMISTMQDEVIRLFYSVGLKDCATYDTADPVAITVGQVLDPTVLTDAQVYTNGLLDLRTKYAETGRFSTFYMSGLTPSFHQHLFRASFYEPINGTTLATWVGEFLNGKISQVGP